MNINTDWLVSGRSYWSQVWSRSIPCHQTRGCLKSQTSSSVSTRAGAEARAAQSSETRYDTRAPEVVLWAAPDPAFSSTTFSAFLTTTLATVQTLGKHDIQIFSSRNNFHSSSTNIIVSEQSWSSFGYDNLVSMMMAFKDLNIESTNQRMSWKHICKAAKNWRQVRQSNFILPSKPIVHCVLPSK